MIEFKACARLCPTEKFNDVFDELINKLNTKFGTQGCICHPEHTWIMAVDLMDDCKFHFHHGHLPDPKCDFRDRVIKYEITPFVASQYPGMENLGTLGEMTKIYNLIVGRWINENTKEQFIFSLTTKLLSDTDLIIIPEGQPPIKTHYGIGVFPRIVPQFENEYYFNVGYNEGNRWLIKDISDNVMKVQRAHYYEEVGEEFNFVRKIDEDFVDEILQGLNPTE